MSPSPCTKLSVSPATFTWLDTRSQFLGISRPQVGLFVLCDRMERWTTGDWLFVSKQRQPGGLSAYIRFTTSRPLTQWLTHLGNEWCITSNEVVRQILSEEMKKYEH